MRQQVVLDSDVDDDDLNLIHNNPYTDNVKTRAKYRRKTKKPPIKDQSPPPKNRRRNETIENFLEWNCGSCTLSFSDWVDFEAHVISAHEETQETRENTEKCGHCGETFSSTEFQIHMRTAHSTDEETKPECGQSISSPKNLRRHLRTLHSTGGRTKPECGRCGKSFSSNSNLNTHMRTVHSTDEKTKPECGYCGKSFSTQSNLNTHMGIVHSTHKKTKYQCGQCNKSFGWPVNLRRHIRNAHSPHENTRPQCGHCGVTISSVGNLRRHIRTLHSKDKKTKFECGRCGKSFSSPGNLRRHIKTSHSKDKKTKPECGRCGKSFNTQTNLNSHIRTAHSTQKIKIKLYGGNGYTTQSSLNSHMRTVHSTHEKTKPKCDHCGKIFSSKPHIISHIRTVHSTHENTRRQCGHCEKSFSSPGNLKKHVRTKHSTHKIRWQCGCRKCFSSPANLRRHVRMAHSTHKTRWQCGHCEKSFSSTGNINRHVKMDHTVEPEEAAAPDTGVMEEDSHPTETLRVPVTKFTKYKCTCGKIEDTYDASVRHAQEHLVEWEALIRKNGTQCELKFDRHNSGDNSQSLIQTKFDYKTLLKDSWINMFEPTEWSSTILQSSLYKYTRSVKLNWDSEKRDEREGHYVPLYKCGACDLFVDPAKVQNHCGNYRACVALGPQGHECPECQRCFYTPKALSLHREDHRTHKDLRFRIVTFNNEDDVQFNNALKQMSVLFAEDNQAEQEEISVEPETPKINAVNKTKVVPRSYDDDDGDDELVVPVVKYCAKCRSFYSAMNKHPSCPNCGSPSK